MNKNRNPDGSLNISGRTIYRLRKAMKRKTSQRMLADRLQEVGLDLDKNAISKLEQGTRFVTDIELLGFAKFFGVSVDVLLDYDPEHPD